MTPAPQGGKRGSYEGVPVNGGTNENLGELMRPPKEGLLEGSDEETAGRNDNRTDEKLHGVFNASSFSRYMLACTHENKKQGR